MHGLASLGSETKESGRKVHEEKYVSGRRDVQYTEILKLVLHMCTYKSMSYSSLPIKKALAIYMYTNQHNYVCTVQMYRGII